MENVERIDKYLSNAGIASRRDIKKILKQYTVTVNGNRVTSSGVRIHPGEDVVAIDGRVLQVTKHVYFLLHKPAGVISTVSDNRGRESVVDLIPTIAKIFPVGRLDKDTTGLLLLTDDGELTHRLIHPKYHVPKVYQLTVSGTVKKSQLTAFRRGVLLSDGITLPAKAEILEEREGVTIVEVTLIEGRNRQIRRMCEELGMELLALKRVKFGSLSLADLKEGEYRELSEEEIQDLQQFANKKIKSLD
jgi:pseudouridine synthase